MKILSLLLDIVYTFLELFFLYRLIEILLPRRTIKLKRNPWKRWILPGGLIIFHMIIVLLLNQIALTSPYVVVILLISNVIAVTCFWISDILTAVAIVGGYFLALCIEGITEISITGMIGGDELIYQTTMEQGVVRLVYLLICGSIWVVLNLCFHYWLKKKQICLNNVKYFISICIIGIVGFVFILSQMLTSFNVTVNITWYIFLTMLSICIFAIYYVVKSRNLAEQLQAMDAQNEILERNYNQVSEYYAANAKLYHDMKHHFQALHHMLESGKEEDAKEYLSSLKSPSSSYTMKHWTGIDIVDTIISDKVAIAEKQGIHITVDTQIMPQNIAIVKRDLCAIFANLLDNAIEASPKEITVLVKLVQQMLLIQIQNDYQREPKKEKGRFVTSKVDTLHHGWGMQSVETVVNKYNGSMDVRISNEKFCVDIIMNIE